jgi:hypothetical protein
MRRWLGAAAFVLVAYAPSQPQTVTHRAHDRTIISTC